MRVLVLGATGPSGILLTREALAHGHTVVLYVRSPEKIPEELANNTSVVVIKGSLQDEAELSKAMEGVNAVISALGPAVAKGPLYPGGTPIAKGYSIVINAMKKHDVKRIIVLGTTSIKDPNDKPSYVFWALINGVATFARNAYKEVVAIGEVIRNEGNDLEWTIVRVPILTSQPSKEVVAGYVGDGKVKTRLARAAFAFFVLEEMSKNEWTRKAPVICSP